MLCLACSKQLDKRNKSGFCRNCASKKENRDYSNRNIDYSKRNIDYSKIDHSKCGCKNLYLKNKEENDKFLIAYFSKRLLSSSNKENNKIFFSKKHWISLLSKNIVNNSIQLLKDAKIIECESLEEWTEDNFKVTTFYVNKELLKNAAKFDYKSILTPFTIYYFGRANFVQKKDVVVKNNHFSRHIILDGNYTSILNEYFNLAIDSLDIHSTRSLSLDSVIKDIYKYCDCSGCFNITFDRYFESLKLAIEYSKATGLAISYLPKSRFKYKVNEKKQRVLKLCNPTTRFFNEACATKNEEHDPVTRDHLLKSILGKKYYHFDVHSSIPNIIHWVKSHKWENIDWHQKIADESGVIRSLVKYFSLPACFAARNAGTNSLLSNLKYHMYEKKDKRTIEFVKLFIETYGLKDVNNRIEEISKKVIEISLKYYKTTNNGYLFFLESELYLKTWKKLEEMGVKCVMIYDSFYTDKPVNIAEVISSIANN